MFRRLRPSAAIVVIPVAIFALATIGVPVGASAPVADACVPSTDLASLAAAEPTTDPAAPSTPDDTPPVTPAFGPLAQEPALRVTVSDTIFDADRVPGGVLVTTGPESGPNALTLVEDSGNVRWRSCTDTTPWVATAQDDPTTTLVSYASHESPADALTIDLATGGVRPSDALPTGEPRYPWDLDADQGLALFGPAMEAFDLPAGSDLTLVDVASDTATAVASPEIPATVVGPSFRIGADGTVGLFGLDGAYDAVALAYAGGAWTDDPTAIDAAFPIWTTYATDTPITFFAASGAEVWSLSGISWTSDEGFHSLQDGHVMLVRGCTDLDPESFTCSGPVLLAVDAATGAELWRRDVEGGVIDAADGYALVGTAGADGAFSQTMIDVATGEPVDGQVWAGEVPPFSTGCCGDPSFTMIDGDAALTSSGPVLTLFVPLADAVATVEVSL